MSDKPLNGGFVCSKHHIGYITGCPSCSSETNKRPYSKKMEKKMRQWLKKKK